MTHLDTDVRRGHCYVRTDDRVVASLIDLGGSCAIETDGPIGLTEAALLGRALMSWSAWRRHITPTLDHYDTPTPPTTARREDER